MAHFIFKSRKAGGEVHKGEQDAKDRYELYKILKESGEEVIFAEEKKAGALSMDISLPFFNTIKTQEKIKFSRNLGSMIKAGLSMSQALSVMERQETNKTTHKIIAALNDGVRKGRTLSDCMSEFPKMFSPMMIAMVRSGEQSGTLSQALRIITVQMDKSHSLYRRVRGALIYPSVIFCAMIGISIILFTYVVPTLTKTFKELNLALPVSTRFVMFISDLLRNQGIMVFAVLFALLGLLYIWSKKESGKSAIHRLILKIPIIGNLVKEVNVAHTARTLSSLIESDVEVLDSLSITADILQNIHYKRVLEKSMKTVERGEPLSKI
ncbi:MAG: type II secretion system F family protein, partial [bacterium]|nr:type II secretion system F family protein [bacterium]